MRHLRVVIDAEVSRVEVDAFTELIDQPIGIVVNKVVLENGIFDEDEEACRVGIPAPVRLRNPPNLIQVYGCVGAELLVVPHIHAVFDQHHARIRLVVVLNREDNRAIQVIAEECGPCAVSVTGAVAHCVGELQSEVVLVGQNADIEVRCTTRTVKRHVEDETVAVHAVNIVENRIRICQYIRTTVHECTARIVRRCTEVDEGLREAQERVSRPVIHDDEGPQDAVGVEVVDTPTQHQHAVNVVVVGIAGEAGLPGVIATHRRMDIFRRPVIRRDFLRHRISWIRQAILDVRRHATIQVVVVNQVAGVVVNRVPYPPQANRVAAVISDGEAVGVPGPQIAQGIGAGAEGDVRSVRWIFERKVKARRIAVTRPADSIDRANIHINREVRADPGGFVRTCRGVVHTHIIDVRPRRIHPRRTILDIHVVAMAATRAGLADALHRHDHLIAAAQGFGGETDPLGDQTRAHLSVDDEIPEGLAMIRIVGVTVNRPAAIPPLPIGPAVEGRVQTGEVRLHAVDAKRVLVPIEHGIHPGPDLDVAGIQRHRRDEAQSCITAVRDHPDRINVRNSRIAAADFKNIIMSSNIASGVSYRDPQGIEEPFASFVKADRIIPQVLATIARPVDAVADGDSITAEVRAVGREREIVVVTPVGSEGVWRHLHDRVGVDGVVPRPMQRIAHEAREVRPHVFWPTGHIHVTGSEVSVDSHMLVTRCHIGTDGVVPDCINEVNNRRQRVHDRDRNMEGIFVSKLVLGLKPDPSRIKVVERLRQGIRASVLPFCTDMIEGINPNRITHPLPSRIPGQLIVVYPERVYAKA